RPIPGAFYSSREELIQDTRQVGFIRSIINNRDEAKLRRVWDRGIYINKRPDESDYNEYIQEMLKQRCNDDAYWSLASFNITNDFTGINNGNGHISDIKIPILAFHGEKDYICEPWQAKDNKEAFGKQMDLIMLDGAGHSSFTDYPEEIGNKFSNFVKDIL
ncbi:MAG: alpha/beta hydrolase, partial [Clostridiales bacterium]|nr:alpha/beta hydrolase [Clostridiales bacterium]